MGLHFREDDSDDMVYDYKYKSSDEEEPGEAAVNLNTNVSFDASLYSSSEVPKLHYILGVQGLRCRLWLPSFCSFPVILV